MRRHTQSQAEKYAGEAAPTPAPEALADVEILALAIKKAGSSSQFARAMKVAKQTITTWRTRGLPRPHVRQRVEAYVGTLGAPVEAQLEREPWLIHEWQERQLEAACREVLSELKRQGKVQSLWAVFRVLEIFSGWSAENWQRLYEKRQLGRSGQKG